MRPLNLHVEELRRDGDGRGCARRCATTATRSRSSPRRHLSGDMLLKNFGVTRHDRIVFYDYDEIAPMTDVVFRRIPPPATTRTRSRRSLTGRGSQRRFPGAVRALPGGRPGAREMFYEYTATCSILRSGRASRSACARLSRRRLSLPRRIRFPRVSASTRSRPR